jgi:putative ABC transport system ATP-binding protein
MLYHHAVSMTREAGAIPRESAADPAVVCDSVTHTFARSTARPLRESAPTVTALHDVSLQITAGDLTVVAGASGSGKTTLLHLLGGLEPPTDGQVSINGVPTTELSERERTALRREQIGLVFQRFHLLPALTARANVAVPLIDAGVPRAQRRAQATALLEQVGLGDRLTHRPGELSGGEQQRVAIARALVGDPAILLADEPTGELDTATGSTILDLLSQFATDRAVIVATHDEAVIQVADRVIELKDGTVICDAR